LALHVGFTRGVGDREVNQRLFAATTVIIVNQEVRLFFYGRVWVRLPGRCQDLGGARLQARHPQPCLNRAQE
jgi:hypothetical protein